MERAERSGPRDNLKRSVSGLPLPKKKGSGLRFDLGVPPTQDHSDEAESDTDSTESGMLESLRSRGGSSASVSSNRSSFTLPTVQVAEAEPWADESNMEQHFQFEACEMGVSKALSPRNVEKAIRRCVVNE
jgi:hypothetical protein